MHTGTFGNCRNNRYPSLYMLVVPRPCPAVLVPPVPKLQPPLSPHVFQGHSQSRNIERGRGLVFRIGSQCSPEAALSYREVPSLG